ncbi:MULTISPECIES: undecaprenyl-diphosphate phosphatase [Arsenicicoccus]|uniref:Undecaprenyl-diphosphatase n=1 Tax=Arsenicicoccus bolidensis TaxID=229480 RepID=A0ABS9Q6J7_9MICO|nr:MULTISPECIES: undecaprenyl-diphosphate phosphatase [Arsenicicoccus]AKT52600.1 UDP pyrophosphate phosphatase [Arsenicicoccus sp. oral taxon 190]MCG7323497.1 undecaprenyl-diphosphate phosphatase [Arsenicicoccus bolidensis]
MSWGIALVLGFVQGLTEFLPISSSAHMRVVAALAGWPDPGAAFTAVTQLGTESAVLLYFRRDITAIVTAWTRSVRGRVPRSDPHARLGWYVIIGTVPIGILGLAFQDTIETALRDLRLVAATLIVFGLVLGLADRVAANRRPLEALTTRQALALGTAQALALIPGVSRSGGTISAGLLLGYTRTAAARYAFLLAVPAVLASGGLELTKLGEGPAPEWGPTALATVVAFGTGYLVIAWFLRYISTHRFTPFVWYRVGLGVLLLGLLGAGLITP